MGTHVCSKKIVSTMLYPMNLTCTHAGGREQILERKRQEYRDLVPEYFDIANSERSEEDLTALNQVSVEESSCFSITHIHADGRF